MKKKVKILLAGLVATLGLAVCSACGETATETPPEKPPVTQPEQPGPEQPGPEQPGPEQPGPEQPADKEITGVSFEPQEVVYNGEEHELLITGNLPTGVEVSYTNNKGTDAGTYNATVVLSGEGYITKTLTATLVIKKATITGVSFTRTELTYDGDEHELLITGTKPAGVEVVYTNNKGTDADTYNAKAVLSGKNYETLTLTATLLIKKATITGVTFKSENFEYDGTAKTIEVVGNLPMGADIVYSCVENSSLTNSATETGSYTIKAKITHKNYETLNLEAVLKITADESDKAIISYNDTLYFANSLHNDYLYSYDGTSVEKVTSDVPRYFTVMGGEVFFQSKSLFGSTIKSVGSIGANAVASEKGEYLVTDGSYIYFVINGLTDGKSGIYKLNLNGEEPEATRLAQGKAKYLQYYDGYLYFADGANGYKLTRISVSGGSKTLVRDEKIRALTVADGYLYYTVNNLLGDYIENYRISNGEYKKLTTDAGANLTVIGDDLYYVNVDLLNSAVFGDGIYCVKAKPLVNNQLPGAKVLGDDTYSSLVKVGDDKIAYYRVSDQMLCVYDISSESVEEVLDGFEKPVETPLSLGSKTAVYNGIVYYLDLYNEKVLSSYNIAKGTTQRITSNKVTDFVIIGDYLYYNAVSFAVNNDLYKINLKTGGLAEKVSKNDCVDVVFDGSKIFYVEQNAAGVRTAIHEIDENGVDTIVYSKGASNLRYYDGNIFFVDGDTLYKMPTNGWVQDTATELREKDVDVFEISDGVIYFREVLLVNKNLSKINVDGTGYAVMIAKTYDPVEIVIQGDTIYFYSDTAKSATKGLYKINKDGTGETKLMESTVNGTAYFVSSFSVAGDDIYFINYALGGVGGDSYLYKFSTKNNAVTKIA